MYQMTLKTGSHIFEAFGTTLGEVHNAMRGALQKHADDFELPSNWYLPYWDNADYRLAIDGFGYRDGIKVYER